jgi:hypothetical protein
MRSSRRSQIVSVAGHAGYPTVQAIYGAVRVLKNFEFSQSPRRPDTAELVVPEG